MLHEHLQENTFSLEDTRPAGFWVRLAAYLIDFLILMVFAVGSLFMNSALGYLILMIPVVAYKPVLEGTLGGTAGKLAIGLKVVNQEGKLLGIAGAFVRNGILILPVIPNILLQLKMIEQGISPFDPQAIKGFQGRNELLYMAYYGFSVFSVVSCVVAAFTVRKRAIHDFVADSYVIYKNSSND